MKSVINTRRLILRRFEESDRDDLFEFLSQLETDEFEGFPGIRRDKVREQLRLRVGSEEYYAVEHRASGKVIGNIYCGMREFDTRELGAIINEDYRRQGYAAEALAAVAKDAFETGIHRVFAACDPRNTASRKLLEKLAFRREAHFREDVFFHTDENGRPKWKDTYVYALLRGDAAGPGADGRGGTGRPGDRQPRRDAEKAARAAVGAVLPEKAVARALAGKRFPGRVFLVAVGKAAYRMAAAALEVLESPVADGLVITKYGHLGETLPGLRFFEAGHPVPDENSVRAAAAALALTEGLREDDTVLFLLSGGGSALFEKPLIPLEELQAVTKRLLACGADIVEINTIRKRLSAVKGGRFAAHCAPARVEALILSDVLGDPLDMIASGPVSPDSASCGDALRIAEKYGLELSGAARRCLETETPKALDGVGIQIVGSVGELCRAAATACREMGYEPVLLTDRLDCEAREAGRFLASILRSHARDGRKLAFLAGGETVVHVTGDGLGGRNQELALAACEGIRGLDNAAIISVGSDGTDGPTDAAGGCVDGGSYDALKAAGLDPDEALRRNDAYRALRAIGGLIVTGPTGTNVNDIAIALLDGA